MESATRQPVSDYRNSQRCIARLLADAIHVHRCSLPLKDALRPLQTRARVRYLGEMVISAISPGPLIVMARSVTTTSRLYSMVNLLEPSAVTLASP